MSFLLLLPTVLSVLVFCAHLMRAGFILLIPPVLLSLLLLLLKQGWVARFFQIALVFIAMERVLTGAFLVNERYEAGLNWIRPALILGGVAAFAMFAAMLFETAVLHRRYPRQFRI